MRSDMGKSGRLPGFLHVPNSLYGHPSPQCPDAQRSRPTSAPRSPQASGQSRLGSEAFCPKLCRKLTRPCPVKANGPHQPAEPLGVRSTVHAQAALMINPRLLMRRCLRLGKSLSQRTNCAFSQAPEHEGESVKDTKQEEAINSAISQPQLFSQEE